MDKLPVVPEASVLRECLELLRLRGIPAWRSNSRVFIVPGKGGRPRPMRAGLGKGSSDIIGILPPHGRFIACECKRKGERPTPDQFAWLAAVNEAGGLGFWVDDSSQVDFFLGLESGKGG